MTEKEQLASLTRNEKKFFSRRVCAWCDMPLNRTGCAAIFDEPCPETTRMKRRKECLKTYKPRRKRHELDV